MHNALGLGLVACRPRHDVAKATSTLQLYLCQPFALGADTERYWRLHHGVADAIVLFICVASQQIIPSYV